jgi:hypothetical protein
MKNTAPKSSSENRPSITKALSIGAVGKSLREPAKPEDLNDIRMGAQLTSQYERAVGGMTEVLKFGALMMMLREILSTRGQLKKGGRADDGKGGIDGWLKRYAPQIKHATAYRFLHVAESVMAAFAVPAKISFVELATTPAAELPEKLRQKQTELWDFVSGTSQRSWLDRLAPVVARAGATDEDLGAQLTEQYGRASGGMTEVLKFGAMMMMLRQHVADAFGSKSTKSTRGLGEKSPSGKDVKDGGVDAWLKRYAPEIKHATAYRFLHVAESVMAAFAVPAKISFVELATTPAAELPEKLRQKQTELWEFANGTSQKSWLDHFKPQSMRGGRHHPRKERSLEEQDELLTRDAHAFYLGLRALMLEGRTETEKLSRLPLVAANPREETGLEDLINEVELFLATLKDQLELKKKGNQS